MNNTDKTIECHDCGAEITIKDEYDEINTSDIKYCPHCGSENIDVHDDSE